MKLDEEFIIDSFDRLDPTVRERIIKSISYIVNAKRENKKIVAVIGSGPNLHEGVTTLLSELIDKGIVDGIITSSAVVAHEMAGCLEKVRRIDGTKVGIPEEILPKDHMVELSILPDDYLEQIRKEIAIDETLFQKMSSESGNVIIKAAGNLAYPTGLRTEILSKEILSLAQRVGQPLEMVAGIGADPYTMIGAAAKKGIPLLVSVPQLVGGGMVGMAIGDSIPISKRSNLVGKMLERADVIIESGVALVQEIHDGPYETYVGHGYWHAWTGNWSYSLKDKRIIRIDLDPNIEVAWEQECRGKQITVAIEQGLPKTKFTKVPFRMEMSGFARIEGSLPIIGDIGEIWPIIAYYVSKKLEIDLQFISYPQSTNLGQQVREWIVENVKPINMKKIRETLT